MRRTYITPEYKNSPISGTFNMLEESNFFGSKMLDIEDSLYIDIQNIIYYQQINGEQIDLSIESSIPSYIYSASLDKNNNHNIGIDVTQPNSQVNFNSKWNIKINLRSILENYLFAILKKYRTFEGLKTEMTITNDVNSSIRKYINNNVLNRYKYRNINFYLQYLQIKNAGTLKHVNIWDSNIISDSNIFSKIQTSISFDESYLNLSFTQEKPSDQYSFKYYFSIYFEKI